MPEPRTIDMTWVAEPSTARDDDPPVPETLERTKRRVVKHLAGFAEEALANGLQSTLKKLKRIR